jgi:hypothetical protein
MWTAHKNQIKVQSLGIKKERDVWTGLGAVSTDTVVSEKTYAIVAHIDISTT